MELGIERTREATPHREEIGYRVDDLIVDVRRQRVVRGNNKISLSPLSYDLLLALVRAAPNLVSLDELMHRVWPTLVVSPETVSQRVKLVRHALGDNAISPRYIAGVRGRGYRMIAEVVAVAPSDTPGGGGAAVPEAAPSSIDTPALPALRVPRPATSETHPGQRRLLRRILYPTVWILAAALLFAINGGRTLQDWLASESPTSAAGPAANSLAVLPFANLSGDAESEHFSDGLSEEILNRLSRAPGLRVLARTSSFAYKDSGVDAQTLKDLLGVRYLLEGSVRREGRQLRVTAQLIDESGFRIWGESYDHEVTGIFAIQDEIAASVATSILPQVAEIPKEPVNPHAGAYERYLIGREILHKRLQNADVLAPQELERAVEIDPSFAEARAELAIALVVAARAGKGGDALDRAQQEIDTALSLKPGLARAHAAQGFLLLARHVVQMQPLDGPRIEAALRTALALDPNMVDARNWLATVLSEEGHYDEARAEWERTAEIAPLAPAVNTSLAGDMANQGDYAQAERRLRRLLKVPEPSISVFRALDDLYFTTGRLVGSNEIAKQLARTGVKGGRVSNELLVTSYARLGRWDAAEYWQDRTERERDDETVTPSGQVALLRLQGRYAEAAAALEATLDSDHPESAAAPLLLELGTLHALAGDYRAAIEALEPASVGDFTPAEPGVDAGHGLAWAYLQTGAPERAQPILEGLQQFFLAVRDSDRLHRSGMLYLFAQNAILAGDHDFAIARLRQAVAAGWRDYFRLLHDPRWNAVRDDRRFQALMATVEADVDRQRAQLEHSDDNDFVGRIDAVVAARRR
ncbi:MAG: winged helix-turn-helix domain-containing protein [Woeseia sp.]